MGCILGEKLHGLVECFFFKFHQNRTTDNELHIKRFTFNLRQNLMIFNMMYPVEKNEELEREIFCLGKIITFLNEISYKEK